MTFQVESPKITEIQVRMDCNGCVQKIRRALQTVQGIYKAHEDFSQQKIIVVGWADPDVLMKAIKKAGKIAKLCSHTDVEPPKTEEKVEPAEAAPAPATESPPEQNTQTPTEQNNAENKPPEEAPPPPAEAPPAETPPAEAPPAETPPAEAPPADPKPEEKPDPSPPPPPAQEGSASETAPPPVPCEAYYMNSYPRYEYVVRDGFYGYHMGTQEYMMRHNGPEYVRRYQRDPYYYTNNNGRSSDGFSTVFSDENPNACCIA